MILKNAKVFIAILFLTTPCISQTSQNYDKGWGDLNYSVPESPAFKILGTGASNILRPTSTRDIAVAIGDYYLNNGTTIPRNVAVEISPSLFNPKVNLGDYEKERAWYTSAYSIGTKVNPSGSYAVALGAKMKLIDDADLRTNKKLRAFIDSYGMTLPTAYVDAKAVVAKAMGYENDIVGFNQILADPSDAHHVKAVEMVNSEINKKVDLDKISKFRNEQKDSLWNAQVWDIGLGVSFASKDSLLKNLSTLDRVGIWTTYGLPLSSQSQLLIGLNALLKDDSTGTLNTGNGNVGARVYWGRNDIKGFVEAECVCENKVVPLYKGGAGLETTFSGGIWITFDLGFDKMGSQPAKFAPSVSISFAPGEKTTH